MSNQLSKYWWIYLSKIHLVRGRCLSCASVACSGDVLRIGNYCVRIFNEDFSAVYLYCEIIMGCVIGVDVLDADLCLGFL